MAIYKDHEFRRVVTERELEQEWLYCEYKEDFYDWLDGLITDGIIELIEEEN